MKPRSLFFPAFLAFSLPAAAEEPTPEQLSFFNDEVLPIFEQNCYKCHGADDKLKGGLRLTSREGLIHGGELGSSYNAENPAASLLLEMISYKDDEHHDAAEVQVGGRGRNRDALTKWVDRNGSGFYDPEKRNSRAAPCEHGATHIQAGRILSIGPTKKVERPAVPEIRNSKSREFAIRSTRFIAAKSGCRRGLEANPPCLASGFDSPGNLRFDWSAADAGRSRESSSTILVRTRRKFGMS